MLIVLLILPVEIFQCFPCDVVPVGFKPFQYVTPTLDLIPNTDAHTYVVLCIGIRIFVFLCFSTDLIVIPCIVYCLQATEGHMAWFVRERKAPG